MFNHLLGDAWYDGSEILTSLQFELGAPLNTVAIISYRLITVCCSFIYLVMFNSIKVKLCG